MRPFIAIDWGTTNCRAYLCGANSPRGLALPELGISKLSLHDYPRILSRIRSEFGDAPGALPVLIAGMAGSNRGWVEAPYALAPAGVTALARMAVAVPGMPQLRIVPGIKLSPPNRVDVMRGEETQVLGAGAGDGAYCLPGTHTKWVRAQDGDIQSFATAMAGEVFHLLRTQSILKGSLPADIATTPDSAGFLAGLAAAKQGQFLTSAFGLRAQSLLEGRQPAWCEGYLSGLVIGTDIREGAPEPGTIVHIIAADALAPLYADGLRAVGCIPKVIDGVAAFTRGAGLIAAQIDWGS